MTYSQIYAICDTTGQYFTTVHTNEWTKANKQDYFRNKWRTLTNARGTHELKATVYAGFRRPHIECFTAERAELVQRRISTLLQPWRINNEIFKLQLTDEELFDIMRVALNTSNVSADQAVKLMKDKAKDLYSKFPIEPIKGNVYLMEVTTDEGDVLYKVGCSTDPFFRRQRIGDCLNGGKVRLINTKEVHDQYRFEQLLHITLMRCRSKKNYSSKQNGEYKDMCSELFEHVNYVPAVFDKFCDWYDGKFGDV